MEIEIGGNLATLLGFIAFFILIFSIGWLIYTSSLNTTQYEQCAYHCQALEAEPKLQCLANCNHFCNISGVNKNGK